MIEILKPNIFDENEIIAGVTLKNQQNYPPYGFTVSNGEIAKFNTVESNRIALAEVLGVNRANIGFQKQVHSDNIRIMTLKDNVNDESDGMITNEKQFILSISIADCAAVLMYDPVNEVICGVHSGWKGTQLNITSKAINILIDKFSTNPNDLQVYVSPCAGGTQYEVGPEFADIFPNSILKISNNKYLFDNKKEIKSQLLKSGVNELNLEISDICTISDNNFHSFRRDKETSGRMSAFIGMRK
jgi:YfiH family protein